MSKPKNWRDELVLEVILPLLEHTLALQQQESTGLAGEDDLQNLHKRKLDVLCKLCNYGSGMLGHARLLDKCGAPDLLLVQCMACFWTIFFLQQDALNNIK